MAPPQADPSSSSLRARGGTGKGGRKASAPRPSRVDDDVQIIEDGVDEGRNNNNGRRSSSRPASASAGGGGGRRSASRGKTPEDEEDEIYDLEYVSDEEEGDDGDGGGGDDGDPACAVAGPLTLAARQQQQQQRQQRGGNAAASDPFSSSSLLPGEPADFTSLRLKPDHAARPLWVCPDGRIFLETFSPVYRQATDFLVAVAEPLSRPATLHEYALTPHSLYAAVSVGLSADSIVAVLQRLSKVELPPEVAEFVAGATGNFGKVKLVLRRSRFHVEASDPAILRRLLRDKIIKKARVLRDAQGEEIGPGSGSDDDGDDDDDGGEENDDDDGDDLHDLRVGDAPEELAGAEIAAEVVAGIEEAEAEAAEQQAAAAGGTGTGAAGAAGAAATAPAQRPPLPSEELQRFRTPATGSAPASQVHSFEIRPSRVEHVKARCLPDGLNYPMLEEYDFRNDAANPDLPIALKPGVSHRPYQDKAMAKMFGNGRARSGVVVLPCGAGKSLVGVTAAARIRKSTLVLVTNQVSVDQWRHQFKLWTNLQDHNIARFTADAREAFEGDAGVCITTYTMVAFSGRRSSEAAAVMASLSQREWGLLIMDEVHVVPAAMFRRVIGIVKAHCKLGLTATLVREDALIADLNFLIGPKLYEANWLDLTRAGHIARVQCAEVWCPMTREFYREYLRPGNGPRRALLYAMNPTKFAACALLVDYHERVRRDKVIVFSDNIFALREYAVRLRRPFIYGGTGHAERTRVLARFKTDPSVNTVFLSKVGDNSIDIPEANVLIQISSHAGSRRQEAQRLGRILRAKRPPGGGPPPPDEFNAFFYTLVSTDTQEMYYSAKRQQFLIDQGYAFKVITNLLDGSSSSNSSTHPSTGMLSTREEQLDLLAKVLAAGEEEAGEEVLPGAPRAAPRPGFGGGFGAGAAAAGAARRATGSLAALSGAGGLTYLEFQQQQQQQRHEQQRRSAKTRMTTKSGKARHILFRKREQGLL